MEKSFHAVTLELIQGDITNQPDLDAVVNAANAQLTVGGGVAGALHRAAGPELDKACRPLAPIEPGEAVITEGFKLPNPHVIHCLGPVYGVDEPSDQLLARCYLRALSLAEDRQLESIGFPALSTGAFGYPLRDAAAIALDTVVKKTAELEHLKRVRFILFSEGDLQVHQEVLAGMG